MVAEPRILAVDDEESVRDAFVNALEDMPCVVGTASSGQEAVEKAQDGPLSLVFLDLKMPGMDGMEFLRRLRALDETAPVCIVTAFHGEFDSRLQAAEDEGIAFELLHKPIGQDAIVSLASDRISEGTRDALVRIRRALVDAEALRKRMALQMQTLSV